MLEPLPPPSYPPPPPHDAARMLAARSTDLFIPSSSSPAGTKHGEEARYSVYQRADICWTMAVKCLPPLKAGTHFQMTGSPRSSARSTDAIEQASASSSFLRAIGAMFWQ